MYNFSYHTFLVWFHGNNNIVRNAPCKYDIILLLLLLLPNIIDTVYYCTFVDVVVVVVVVVVVHSHDVHQTMMI